MNEREAFIRSICEQPEDDVRRLAFADWLEENGERERAEFVRAQVRWEAGVEPWTPAACLRSGEERWWFMNDILPKGVVGWEYSRGFVSSIRIRCADFLKHARDLFAAHPVTEVRLTDVIPELHPRYDEPNGNPHIIIGVETDKDTLFGARVPMELFDLLPGAVVGYDDDFLWPHKEYPSFTHNITANEAISVACVAYGRSLVGLPPLAVPAAA